MKITESQLRKIIQETINEIRTKKRPKTGKIQNKEGKWIDATEDGRDKYGNPMYRTHDSSITYGRKCKDGSRRVQDFNFRPNVNESKLRNIIKESIKNVLKEGYFPDVNDDFKNNADIKVITDAIKSCNIPAFAVEHLSDEKLDEIKRTIKGTNMFAIISPYGNNKIKKTIESNELFALLKPREGEYGGYILPTYLISFYIHLDDSMIECQKTETWLRKNVMRTLKNEDFRIFDNDYYEQTDKVFNNRFDFIVQHKLEGDRDRIMDRISLQSDYRDRRGSSLTRSGRYIENPFHSDWFHDLAKNVDKDLENLK